MPLRAVLVVAYQRMIDNTTGYILTLILIARTLIIHSPFHAATPIVYTHHGDQFLPLPQPRSMRADAARSLHAAGVSAAVLYYQQVRL